MGDTISIVHIVHRFDTGGLENGVVNLINRLDERVYQHTIVTMKGYSKEFAKRISTNNVEFADLNKQDGNDIAIFSRLNSLLKKINPDVLHTRNTATLEMQIVGWWRRIPLRIHGEHGWDVNDLHGQNVRYQKLRRFMKLFVHKYVALSIEARDYLLDVIKIQADRVHHICNGVDDNKFSPQESTNKSFVFGCVGRLAEVKNHVLLAEAFGKVWQHTKKMDKQPKLHLIGDGDCREKVEQIFASYGCVKDVWMAGNKDNVASLMKDFDAFVLPSLAEGISNTILEAMSSGLPVIATDVGGNGELVEHDFSGFLVPATDADVMASKMTEYVENPDKAKEHGQNGRALVEQKFSIEAMTLSYDRLYKNINNER